MCHLRDLLHNRFVLFYFSPIDVQDVVSGSKRIQTVVLFDRSIDLVTPFCSQMCYEGLLDEYFRIEGGRMKIPKNETGENTNKQFETISLSTRDDSIIEGIRATHFTKVFQQIKGRRVSNDRSAHHSFLFLQLI
jgi:hypothetical protein